MTPQKKPELKKPPELLQQNVVKMERFKVVKEQSESSLQRQCVKWFRIQYPNLILFAIPNGGKRGIITASIMKAEGVLKGIPDLMLLESSNGLYGLFIEMKVKYNKLSPEQDHFFEVARRNGYQCSECRSLESFIEIITNYLTK